MRKAFFALLSFCFLFLLLIGCDDSDNNSLSTPFVGTGLNPSVVAPPAGTGNPGTTFIPPPPEPVITIVSPVEGPPDVTTSVTISGTDFVGGATVTFGGNPASNIIIGGPTNITCDAPTGVANTAVDIVVQNPTGNPATLVGGFNYVFIASAIDISLGSPLGGDPVTITGNGFATGAQVFFGAGNAATNVMVVDTNTITCDTPAGTGGNVVDVIVENTQAEQAILSAAFGYINAVVTTSADSGAGSLRDLVGAAAPGDFIGFDVVSIGGPITVVSEITIGTDLTLLGPGSAIQSIDGGGVTRIFNITGGTVDISGLTITNASSATGGAGILVAVAGTLNLTNCTLSGNAHTTGGFPGGGRLLNNGTASLTDCTFSGNSADGGGGVFNGGGTLTIDNSTFTGNFTTRSSGGAINNDGGTVTMTNSTLSFNDAEDFGGGGIRNLNASSTLILSNCTITGNAETIGSSGGGGIRTSGPVTVDNTIIAGNTSAGSTDVDINGSFTSAGSNIIGDAGSVTDFTDGVMGDQVGSLGSEVDPMLGPLQSNGGPTETHELLSGSPAIDAGDSTLIEDQRGLPRPVGVGPDIGAFEVQ